MPTFPVERTEHFDPSSLAFTLVLRRSLDESQREHLEERILGWFEPAILHGIYGRPVHSISEFGYDEEDGQPTVEWVIDFGSASEVAFTRLIETLDTAVGELGIPVDRLIVGYRYVP